MIATLEINQKKVKVDFSKPLDISIPMKAGKENVNAFYIPPVTMEPFKSGSFIGDVKQGGSCNVFSINFNPHGNGTHTETVGHISKEKYPIYKCLTTYYFVAELITIRPQIINDDHVVVRSQLEELLKGKNPEALIIRTLPNEENKLTAQYSGTNPPYLEKEAAQFIFEKGIKHLLLDLPSIDREDDGGKLSAHHAFWNYPAAPRTDCTITELIFVPSFISDGEYLLNLQISSFENDASPSKPVLYNFSTI